MAGSRATAAIRNNSPAQQQYLVLGSQGVRDGDQGWGCGRGASRNVSPCIATVFGFLKVKDA